MMNSILTAVNTVEDMNKHLREILKSPKMLWENTYIYHQYEKRKSCGKLTIQDHIRAMVYSMLSSEVYYGNVWKVLPILKQED